jgi:ATP-binding cassette subfamily B protein
MKRGVTLALCILLGVALGGFIRTLRSPDWMRGVVGERSVPVLRQSWERGCGPATLAMVARAWGIDVSQEEVVALSGWKPRGVSMRGLVEAGEKLGLEMVGVKLEVKDLKKVNKPFIAHILPRHLVVVERVDGGKVYIVDPAVGRMSLSIEEFSKRWKGYSLVVVRKYMRRDIR